VSGLGFGVSESVGLGAGLDDRTVEGEPVDDGGAERGSVKVFVQPLKDSFEAMATLLFSSRSVSTWNSTGSVAGSSRGGFGVARRGSERARCRVTRVVGRRMLIFIGRSGVFRRCAAGL
jgi:hypothetical protein